MYEPSVKYFKIWPFIFSVTGMFIVSIITLLIFSSFSASAGAYIFELVFTGSLAFYMYYHINSLQISLNKSTLQEAMTIPRWTKYISMTIFIKVLGIVSLIFFSSVILLVFPGLREFLVSLFFVPEEALEGPTVLRFLVSIITICILTPYWEEYFFRGILLRKFTLKFKAGTSILLSSGIFAVLHIGGNSMIHAFILGCFCSYVYLRTNNIWVPIAIHSFGNFLSVLATLIPVDVADTVIPTTDLLKETALIFGIFCAILFIVLVYLTYRNRYKITAMKRPSLQTTDELVEIDLPQ